MEKNNKKGKQPIKPVSPESDNNGSPKFNSYWIYGIIALFLLGLNFLDLADHTNEPISWGKFQQMVLDHDVEKVEVVNSKVAQVYIKKDKLSDPKYKDAAKGGFGQDRAHYYFEILDPQVFAEQLYNVQEKAGIPDNEKLYAIARTKPNYLAPILSWVLPIVIIVAIWIFIMRRMSGGAGGPGAQIFNIGKSKATLFDQNAKVNVTFADVAGLDEAKEEVMEVVDFLKNPKKYTSLGGKIPKG
ncbi:MAG: ATP-dependent metallopeptidase FtsH/Yme1/Tma family protein, partial [Bacteroidetes bacterium]